MSMQADRLTAMTWLKAQTPSVLWEVKKAINQMPKEETSAQAGYDGISTQIALGRPGDTDYQPPKK
jgi:hypothetical protein